MLPAVVSPEVHADRSVTIRYRDGHAGQIMLQLDGRTKQIPMVKGEAGVWSVTTEPLPPENYGYRIVVDGVRVMDPVNPDVRPNLQFPSSVVRVPGTPPELWEWQNVPHGEVVHHLYFSKMAAAGTGDDGVRNLWVYLPPGYDAKRKVKYPVLYLLHGYSDDAEGWITAGQANLIFDNMIAQGRLKPMVVVMPYAYGTQEMLHRGSGVWADSKGLPTKNQATFSEQMLGEILPMMEARYDIARDAAHRAIAGLSMGGGHSLYTGLNHPDVFGYIGAMSSAIVNDDYEAAYAGRSKAAVKLLWISCGTEDSLITANRKVEAWAKANVKGEVSANETPGIHTWLVWRENLITLVPLLFMK